MNDKSELIDQLRISRDDHEQGGSAKLWWWLLVIGVLAASAYFGWRWWQLRQLPQVMSIRPEVIQVTADQQRASVLDASGYVVARRQATVSSEVTGKLIEVLVEEGMSVEAGQVLARLDSTTEQVQLSLSQAQLQSARSILEEIKVQLADANKTLTRQRQLMEKGLTSQSELDQAEAAVNSLQARLTARTDDVEVSRKNLALRQQLLDELTIKAPFSGVVIAKAAQPGEMVSPISAGGGFTRTGICTIVDMDSLEIEVDVNEAYIQRVSAGQSASAILDAYPDWQIKSEVIAIVPTADRQKATVRVRVGFLESDSRILPDMGVKVRFLEEQRTEVVTNAPVRALQIPASAVLRDNGNDYVFLMMEGEQVERRAVRIADRRLDGVIISAGLTELDQLVAEIPEGGLSDGQKIRAIEP